MHYRTLGKTGYRVSTVSFGAWAIGGSWGSSDDATSMTALHRAVDRGVNFFDTADVYGDGRSERLLGRLRKERSESLLIATKAGMSTHAARGRGLHRVEPRGIRRSQPANARHRRADLVQLHCPPTDVYYRPEVFESMDRLAEGSEPRRHRRVAAMACGIGAHSSGSPPTPVRGRGRVAMAGADPARCRTRGRRPTVAAAGATSRCQDVRRQSPACRSTPGVSGLVRLRLGVRRACNVASAPFACGHGRRAIPGRARPRIQPNTMRSERAYGAVEPGRAPGQWRCPCRASAWMPEGWSCPARRAGPPID